MTDKPVADIRDEGRIWRIHATEAGLRDQLVAVWEYRRFYRLLAARALFDIYRNTTLGVVWMAIQPVSIAVPAIFVVGNIFGVSVAPVPLPLFVMIGLATWLLFARAVQWMTKGVNRSLALTRRVYIPLMLLLLAAISPAIFQALIAFAMFAGLAVYYGPVTNEFHIGLGLRSLVFIPVVLMTLMLAIGVACFTSILNAYGRDTWLTLRYVLSAWMLATPVFYPVDVIAESYRWIIYLNPLTSIVEAARWSLLGVGTVRWEFLGLTGLLATALLVAGLLFFSRQQGRLFDQP